MFLLYLDDAGSEANNNESHLVLGGCIIHEQSLYWINRSMDELANKLFPGSKDDEIEFHCSEIFGGRSETWKHLKDKDDRRQIIKDVLSLIATQCKRAAHRKNRALTSCDDVSVLACAVEKKAFPKNQIMELAFEEICSRFQMFLNRRYVETKEREKGLIILDESSKETALQKMSRDFRKIGNKWGIKTQEIQEVPLFVNSKASRGIQAADAIAYAVYRYYSQADMTYFNIIQNCFDSDDSRMHGLVHKCAPKNESENKCWCPSCVTRDFMKKDRPTSYDTSKPLLEGLSDPEESEEE